MLVASWRRALRTCMGCLLRSEIDLAVDIDEVLYSALGVFQRFLHAVTCRSSKHIMAVECRFECNGSKEVLLELRAKLLAFIEGQLVQLTAFVQTITNSIADFFMGLAEGNSLMNKIGRRSHCIHKSGLASCAHPVGAEV